MADAGGQKKGKPGKKTAKRRVRPTMSEPSRQRANLIWAIAHPLRRRVLRTLARSEETCSPTQMSRQFDLGVSAVAYHIQILQKCGAVELADEQMARGAVEHFYATKIVDDPPIEALLEETREADAEYE
jgi:DNA-binding transcriptional ArsR family regulator